MWFHLLYLLKEYSFVQLHKIEELTFLNNGMGIWNLNRKIYEAWQRKLRWNGKNNFTLKLKYDKSCFFTRSFSNGSLIDFPKKNSCYILVTLKYAINSLLYIKFIKKHIKNKHIPILTSRIFYPFFIISYLTPIGGFFFLIKCFFVLPILTQDKNIKVTFLRKQL